MVPKVLRRARDVTDDDTREKDFSTFLGVVNKPNKMYHAINKRCPKMITHHKFIGCIHNRRSTRTKSSCSNIPHIIH